MTAGKWFIPIYTVRSEFGHLGGYWVGSGTNKYYMSDLDIDGPWRDMKDWRV